eukprot:TRINITY_DN6753_c0_g1_i3.p1 TRINITY_DN6753_c0_g1~~TRINITY_DN6753_c0_g1_i3.p1  ORF type:complete len:792 (+),score=144.82 TRINITY_DN6753_c0_g1_i3:234-2609(+)
MSNFVYTWKRRAMPSNGASTSNAEDLPPLVIGNAASFSSQPAGPKPERRVRQRQVAARWRAATIGAEIAEPQQVPGNRQEVTADHGIFGDSQPQEESSIEIQSTTDMLPASSMTANIQTGRQQSSPAGQLGNVMTAVSRISVHAMARRQSSLLHNSKMANYMYDWRRNVMGKAAASANNDAVLPFDGDVDATMGAQDSAAAMPDDISRPQWTGDDRQHGSDEVLQPPLRGHSRWEMTQASQMPPGMILEQSRSSYPPGVISEQAQAADSRGQQATAADRQLFMTSSCSQEAIADNSRPLANSDQRLQATAQHCIPSDMQARQGSLLITQFDTVMPVGSSMFGDAHTRIESVLGTQADAGGSTVWNVASDVQFRRETSLSTRTTTVLPAISSMAAGSQNQRDSSLLLGAQLRADTMGSQGLVAQLQTEASGSQRLGAQQQTEARRCQGLGAQLQTDARGSQALGAQLQTEATCTMYSDARTLRDSLHRPQAEMQRESIGTAVQAAMCAARRARNVSDDDQATRRSSLSSQMDSDISTLSSRSAGSHSQESRPREASTRVRSSIVSLVTQSRTSTIIALGAARSALDSLSSMLTGIVRKGRRASQQKVKELSSAKRRGHNRRGAFLTDPCQTLAARFDLPLEEVQGISEHMATLQLAASEQDQDLLDIQHFSNFLGMVFSVEITELDPVFLRTAHEHFEAYSEVRLDDFLDWYSWYWEQYRQHKEEVTQIANMFAESAIMLTSLKIMFDRACASKPASKDGTLDRKKCKSMMIKLSECLEADGVTYELLAILH